MPTSFPFPLDADGEFDSAAGWNIGEGWSIASDPVYSLGPIASSSISAGMSRLAIGAEYTVTMVLLNSFIGSVYVECGGVIVIDPKSDAGIYTGIYVPNLTEETISIVANEEWQGDIESISVRLEPYRVSAIAGEVPSSKILVRYRQTGS